MFVIIVSFSSDQTSHCGRNKFFIKLLATFWRHLSVKLGAIVTSIKKFRIKFPFPFPWAPLKKPSSDKGYYILTRYSWCILTLKLSKKTPYNWLARPSGNKISSVSVWRRQVRFALSLAVNLHFQTVYAFCITIIIQKTFSECASRYLWWLVPLTV